MAGGLLVFMHAERIQESGDNYAAVNPDSGAAGAYQFLFSTWQYALRLAGLDGTRYYQVSANEAPPNIQDAAASSLMSTYYFDAGRSWYNVAEAWYGGLGAVGHPDWGGGPGYPTVGQYAADVMAIYNRLSGGQPGPPPSAPSPAPALFSGGFDTLALFYFEHVLGADIAWAVAGQRMPARFWARR